MPLDEALNTALRDELKKRGQPDAVYKRLTKWLEDLADARTDLVNADDVGRHIETILEVIHLSDREDKED